MDLRVSDGYSAAVEFTARSKPEFERNLRRAMLELSGQVRTHRVNGRVWMSAQLHVRTDIRRDWISTRYPNGAVPLRVRLGEPVPADYWDRCTLAHEAGNTFDRGLAGLCNFVSAAVAEEIKLPPLRLVE